MSVVDDFLSQYNPSINRRVKQLLNDFTGDYTVERIKKLTLEDYYHTGKYNTFCYRLEKGLKDDMRIELTDGNRKYLKYHRENVFIA